MIENNGKIVYPYQEAEQKGFTRQQFRDAIDELQEKGLIDIKHLGKGGRKPAEGTGDVSIYWIDDRWKKYGTDAFRPARNPRTRDTRARGWSLINSDPKLKRAIDRKRKATIMKKVRCENSHSLKPNECEKTHQLEPNK